MFVMCTFMQCFMQCVGCQLDGTIAYRTNYKLHMMLR